INFQLLVLRRELDPGLPDPNNCIGREKSFFDLEPSDKSSVRGFKVAKQVALFRFYNFGVVARDGLVEKFYIAAVGASNVDRPLVDDVLFASRFTVQNDQLALGEREHRGLLARPYDLCFTARHVGDEMTILRDLSHPKQPISVEFLSQP